MGRPVHALMRTELIGLLRCPRCAGALEWHQEAVADDRVIEGEAACASCHAVYPVHQGVSLFVTAEDRAADPWARSESGLLRHLQAHPDIERALMSGPLEALAPADQYYRSYVHRLAGRWRESIEAKRVADRGIYSAEERAGRDAVLDALVQRARVRLGWSVDLASGEGTLAARLATERGGVVATDLSPSVLVGARERVAAEGGEIAGALAFDARRTPFRDRSIPTMTTFTGLANIGLSTELLRELRRVVGGALLAAELFFDASDRAHVAAASAAGLAFHSKGRWLDALAQAGWTTRVVESVPTLLRPTPKSALIPGAAIDGLPVRETHGEWCLLEAS